jgi:phosphoribosylamine-glycine ligase
VLEGDTGPNTGGMGSYSPAPIVTPDVSKQVRKLGRDTVPRAPTQNSYCLLSPTVNPELSRQVRESF